MSPGLRPEQSMRKGSESPAAPTVKTVGGAMAVLLPATLFCFAIMARHSSKALSVHFVALNLLLLLPIRSSLAAGSIALAGTIYALYTVSRLLRQDPALKTGEGKFALTTLFIPAGKLLNGVRADIGCHDQYRISKINRTTLAIGQSAVFKNLQ